MMKRVIFLRKFSRSVVYAVVAVLWMNGPQVYGEKDFGLGTLLDGPPALKNARLPESSYISVKAKRFKNPKVLWTNWDFLREKGLPIPEDHELESFQKQILESIAYGIPQNEEEAKVSYLGDEREFLSDRYGGYGTGKSSGSGRAFSIGKVQIKGGGTTVLAGSDVFKHSNGAIGFGEAHRDAIFSELLNRELPYGATRDLFLIDTGTYTHWPDGRVTKRILVVREDPVRPGHFVTNLNGETFDQVSDTKRVRNAVKMVRKSLPKSELGVPLRESMEEYSRRVGAQYGAAFSKRFFHGSTSPSNFEVNGRMLDFGTSTALSGHAPVNVLDHVDSFGELQQTEDRLIRDFSAHIKQEHGLFKFKTRKMVETFRNEYRRQVANGLITLAGFPPHLIQDLEKTPEATQLSDTILKLATRAAADVSMSVDKGVPQKLGFYDLPKIFEVAHSVKDPNESHSVEKVLKSLIQDDRVRADFSRQFSSYYSRASGLAVEQGVGTEAFKKYAKASVKVRNRDLSQLYRGVLDEREKNLIDDYEKTGDASKIANDIDQSIHSHRTEYKDLKPFEIVLEEKRNPRLGTSELFVFDAAKNEYTVAYRFPKSSQNESLRRYSVMGKNLSFSEINQQKFVVAGASSKEKPSIQVLKDGGIEMRLPASSSAERRPSIDWKKTQIEKAKVDPFCLGTVLEGSPEHLGSKLPESSYVKFEAKRIKDAKLVFENWDLLRKKGIKVPSDEQLARFKNEVLDRIAFAIPSSDGSDLHHYTDETREFVADRYGGSGIGNNYGSGRAMSTGKVQLKGIGRTPLVGNAVGSSHSDGTENFLEGTADIVFGDFFDHELPHGANRILFAIDTGIKKVHPDGSTSRRMIIVREDPNRPAHYMQASGRNMFAVDEREGKRAEAAVQKVTETLPTLEGKTFMSESQKLKEGLIEYAERTGKQYGSAMGKRLFHGATSPSNYEVSGKFIDFATATTLPGYGSVKVLDHGEPFLQTTEIKQDLIRSFVNAVSEHFPEKPFPISVAELTKIFDRTYEKQFNRELLALTGLPPRVIEKMEGSKASQRLLNIVKGIAFAKNNVHLKNVGRQMPKKITHYDLNEVMTKLSRVNPWDLEQVHAVISPEVSDPALAHELAGAYQEYFLGAVKEAENEGVTQESLLKYVELNAPMRNQKLEEFHRGNLIDDSARRLKDYELTSDADRFSKELNDKLARARVTYSDAQPYDAVVKEEVGPRAAYTERTLFNARTGGYQKSYRFPIQENGNVEIFGNEQPAESWMKKAFQWEGSAGKKMSPLFMDQSHVVLSVPVNAPEEKVNVNWDRPFNRGNNLTSLEESLPKLPVIQAAPEPQVAEPEVAKLVVKAPEPVVEKVMVEKPTVKKKSRARCFFNALRDAFTSP